MIRNEIDTALAVRNAQIEADDAISFRPICEIDYDDGTKMTTVVGIFAAARDSTLVDACGFDRLDFMPTRGKLVRIKVPKLTAAKCADLSRNFQR